MEIKDYLDPVVIIGTLISVIIAAILFFTGVDPILSFIFGLLGVAVSLLIDLIARTTSLEIKTLQTIDLSHKILKDQWFFTRLLEKSMRGKE